MNGITVLLSLVVGIAAGIMYGFSLIAQNINFFPKNNPLFIKGKQKTFISFFLISIVRIFLIGLLLYYILHTQTLNIILVMLAFLITFWFIIIKKKALYYE